MRTILQTLVLSAALVGSAQAAEPELTDDQPGDAISSSSSTESLGYKTSQTSSPATLTSATYRWTGFYAGIHLGGGFGDTNVATTGQVAANVNNVNGGARPASVTFDRTGILGGGQAGYNHQFGRGVLGFETDLAASGINGRRTLVTTALTGGASLNNTFYSSLNYLGTVRGRVGYSFGRTLVYGTGGFAYGSSDQSASFFGASPANVLQFTGKEGSIRSGYAAGGGIETALHGKFSLKAEYLHYDLENGIANIAVIAGSGGGGTGYNSNFQNMGNLVRAGVNYRF